MRLTLLGIAAAVLLGLFPPASSSAGNTFFGLGQAKDGDSLMVGEREVRLFGIDAPERDQNCARGGKQWGCGQGAADQLMKLVTGKQVSCVAIGTDQHERTLARCSVGNIDVNRTMVALGYAVAYRRYSNDYVSAEETAKVNKRGLWSGTFELPSQYRHDEPVQRPARKAASKRERPISIARSSPAQSGGCSIKGNQGSNGWIYHVPGMPYYEQTQAEQMFCTEADARAAGYRRARVR